MEEKKTEEEMMVCPASRQDEEGRWVCPVSSNFRCWHREPHLKIGACSESCWFGNWSWDDAPPPCVPFKGA